MTRPDGMWCIATKPGPVYLDILRTSSRSWTSLAFPSAILRDTLIQSASALLQRVLHGGSDDETHTFNQLKAVLGVTMSTTRTLSLDSLCAGLPGVSSAVATSYAEACVVGFTRHSHPTGIGLKVSGSAIPTPEVVSVDWTMCASPQVMRSWADPIETTENGACAIAFLLALEYTPYTVIERSYSPTGFDYWLGTYPSEEDFTLDARLEVSGMWQGTPSQVGSRARKKVRQADASSNLGFPAYVAIVEFGEPAAQLEVG